MAMVYEILLGQRSGNENRNRLEVIARIGGMWLRGLANGDIRRASVLAMMAIVDAQISRQEFSDASMLFLSELFCENCRNIQPQVSSLCARKSDSTRDVLHGCYLMSVAK
jgi:hypothetical protein